MIQEFVLNALLSRTQYYRQFLDGRYESRDVDQECGYPQSISIRDYVGMYRRHDIASRIVDIEPNECWKEYPEVYETEEERETDFEKAVDDLLRETRLFSYLHRLDRVSGIGHYGVLLIGVDDGADLDQPAPGFDEHRALPTPGESKVIYYRIFDESAAKIAAYESDVTNPRYGLPLYYNLEFQEVNSDTEQYMASPETKTVKVHWSRTIHVADGLLTSEVLGTPRMENIYNRLLDLRKVNAGSGEMFWKGGFPGYSFEVDPRQGDLTEEDRESVKAEIQKWEQGLSRYFAGVGVTMKSLAPQISDPTPFVNNLLRIIATTKGIPTRLLQGSESGHLASTQDQETWTERLSLRRVMYITPTLIRPTIDRLLQMGALPATSVENGKPKPYTVKWVPLAELSLKDKAEVANKRTEALSRYATAGAEALIPLKEFLINILLLSPQEAEAIVKAPASKRSLVFAQLEGMSGSAGGNAPSSIPKVPKGTDKKDPSKTPSNELQKPKT